MQHIGRMIVMAAVLLVASSCAGSGSDLPDVPSTIVEVGDDEAPDATTTTATLESSDTDDATESTTTTTVFARLVEQATEAPPFEVVTITTEDGEEIYGEFFAGGDVAVLYTHEYNAAATDSSSPRPPQSSASLSASTWTLAENGVTVLAIDFRGHGNSSGSFNVKESKLDMKAAYEFLVERGYTTIVGMGFGGSAPVMATLAGIDPEFDLAGIGMLFTPLAETGHDAGEALLELDEPVWLVGIDAGSFGGVTKRLEPKVQNLYERFIFPRVPSGLQFADVYGAEYLGRQLDFIESVGD